ncbi:GTPase domain-containing protein [Billgrantia pellis]|uniref:GTPase domain-containing protein n=1 Tax=Billgrantia pellis TaxID=2606936 RepID=A0A7V7FX10_9GAMM|nr:GTPase domain-containing protein [Halomonas pellis]KAA0010010.1 GTPase domain-containing protein [Halomonas pellis]
MPNKIVLKIVYYGPAMSGKTTNLLQLHALLDPQRMGELMVMETRDDRTLFFDMLPIGFQQEQTLDIRLKLYTVPGQVEHDSTRKAVLSRADGVIFVADSQLNQQENNAVSFENLADNLHKVGLDIERIPLVVQFNKRDLSRIVEEKTLRERWSSSAWWPLVLSSALKGHGVIETFERLLERLYPAVNEAHGLSRHYGIDRSVFLERLTRCREDHHVR